MDRSNPLAPLTTLVLILVAAASALGCSENQARHAAPRSEAPPVEEPAGVVATGLEERARVLDRREAALGEREGDLAELERDLSGRLDELERGLETLQRYENELLEREQTLELREQAPATIPDPEPLPVAAAEREGSEAPTPRLVTLPVSTRLEVTFDQPLSSETSESGDSVRARIERDVYWTGLNAVPAGSTVDGAVVAVTPPRKIGGKAALTVRFERLTLPSGEVVPIRATWSVEGRSQAKKDAATIGGSAAGGAILGRVLSKDKGKGGTIGAILGGAVGAAVASKNRSDTARIDPGEVVELRLDDAVQIAVAPSEVFEDVATTDDR